MHHSNHYGRDDESEDAATVLMGGAEMSALVWGDEQNDAIVLDTPAPAVPYRAVTPAPLHSSFADRTGKRDSGIEPAAEPARSGWSWVSQFLLSFVAGVALVLAVAAVGAVVFLL